MAPALTWQLLYASQRQVPIAGRGLQLKSRRGSTFSGSTWATTLGRRSSNPTLFSSFPEDSDTGRPTDRLHSCLKLFFLGRTPPGSIAKTALGPRRPWNCQAPLGFGPSSPWNLGRFCGPIPDGPAPDENLKF